MFWAALSILHGFSHNEVGRDQSRPGVTVPWPWQTYHPVGETACCCHAQYPELTLTTAPVVGTSCLSQETVGLEPVTSRVAAGTFMGLPTRPLRWEGGPDVIN